MGGSISREQMNDYREVVKDRISEDAISFLHSRFIKAAPSGEMTPTQFKHYIDSTDVFKDRKIRGHSLRFQGAAAGQSNTANEIAAAPPSGKVDEAAAATVSVEDVSPDYYRHLFRGYDLDNAGVITFKKFLVYHLAIVYSTEELFFVVFNTFDADGDGCISLADVKEIITAATRYVGDCDVEDREVRRVIDEEARRLIGFLDIRKEGYVRMGDMQLIVKRYPQVLEKMKHLM